MAYSRSSRKCSKNKTLYESFFLFINNFANKMKKASYAIVGGTFMFYIPQILKNDCGFACLKMVLANINKDKNYLFLPQDEAHGHYSYSDLLELGKTYGVNFVPFEATEKSELSNCSSFPLILTITLKNGAKHAVVVTKVKWKRVYYLDPRKGSGSLSLNKFLSIWDGTGLMVESFEKRKCPIVPPNPMKISSSIVLGFIQLTVAVLAAVGVYFVKDGTPIYIPAIFLALAIVVELVMKAVTYQMMKKLDHFFFSESNIPVKGYKEYLTRFENYKRLSLTSPINFLLLLVILIGLSAVVLLNDKRNIMLVLVPLVIAIFDVLVVVPLLKNKRNEINELEDDLDNAEDSADLQSKAKVLHTKAYNYGFVKMTSLYVYAGLIVLVALLTMRLCGISSFPYIIFYACISTGILRTLQDLFDYNEKIEEFNAVKVKISNSINSSKEND